MKAAQVEDNFWVEEPPEETPYQKWMRHVNEEMRGLFGVDMDDLPDVDTYAMFAAKVPIKVAAKRAYTQARRY
jgi:hypothetical protein